MPRDEEEQTCGKGKPPQVRKCPNCDEESLRLHPSQREWVCDNKNCGYSEPA